MIVIAVTLLPEPDRRRSRAPDRAQAERDARRNRAVHDVEVGLQAADVEQGVAGGGALTGAGTLTVPHARDRGSNASQAVTDEVDRETVTMIAAPEKNGHHQLPWGMNVRAFARMLPQVGCVGSTPKPRKLMNASVMMLAPTSSDAATTIGLRRSAGCAEDDPPVADADRPRRLHELAFADRQEEAPPAGSPPSS